MFKKRDPVCRVKVSKNTEYKFQLKWKEILL